MRHHTEDSRRSPTGAILFHISVQETPPEVHIALDWPLVGLALVSSSSFLVVTTCALGTLDVVIQSEYKAYSHKCCTLPATGVAQLP